jgi:hypothetical protein
MDSFLTFAAGLAIMISVLVLCDYIQRRRHKKTKS